MKGQETDECSFFCFCFFGFLETPKPKKQKKHRPIGDPKVKGQETDECVFFVFLFFLVLGSPIGLFFLLFLVLLYMDHSCKILFFVAVLSRTPHILNHPISG